MRISFLHCLFILLFACPFSIRAQQWVTYNTSTSDLPNNTVRSITVDEQNNKWIATDNGLAKFDGVNWTIYNDTNSGLPNNTIRCVAIDELDNKWIGTAAGLVKFDDTNWTVYNPNNSGIPDDLVRDIDFDSQGDVWVATTTGIGRFDGTNWYVYSSNDSSYNSQILTSENIPTIAINDNDVVAVGTINGGLIYLTDTTFTLFDSWTTNLPDNTILDIAYDSEGNRWMGTPGAGLLAHRGEHTSTVWSWYNTWNSPAHSNSINTVIVDNEDRIITGSQNTGVSVFSGGLNWVNFNSTNSGLPEDFIYALALDNEGYLWAGTYNSGLARFNYQNWLGAEELTAIKLNVYPNPSAGVFNVSVKENANLEVTDIYGRIVYATQVGVSINKLELDVADGVYLVTVYTSTAQTSKRLIITR